MFQIPIQLGIVKELISTSRMLERVLAVAAIHFVLLEINALAGCRIVIVLRPYFLRHSSIDLLVFIHNKLLNDIILLCFLLLILLILPILRLFTTIGQRYILK